MLYLGPKQKGGLYHLIPASDILNVAFVTKSRCCSISSNNLWHYRLGHMSLPMLRALQPNNSAITFSDSLPCGIILLTKNKKLTFPSNQHKSQHIFDLIHCDIWGTMSVSTLDGYRYFLIIVDDLSRSTWLYLMHSKSQTSKLIQSFFVMVNT